MRTGITYTNRVERKSDENYGRINIYKERVKSDIMTGADDFENIQDKINFLKKENSQLKKHLFD